jgi:hypothetical protein
MLQVTVVLVEVVLIMRYGLIALSSAQLRLCLLVLEVRHKVLRTLLVMLVVTLLLEVRHMLMVEVEVETVMVEVEVVFKVQEIQ